MRRGGRHPGSPVAGSTLLSDLAMITISAESELALNLEISIFPATALGDFGVLHLLTAAHFKSSLTLFLLQQ